MEAVLQGQADYLTDGTGRVQINSGMGVSTGICDHPSAAAEQVEFARKTVAFLHRNQREDWLKKWASDCIEYGYKNANTWLRQRAKKHKSARELIARFYPENLPLIAHHKDSIALTAADCATWVINIIAETPASDTAAFDAFEAATQYARKWHIDTGYEQAALGDHIEEAALCGLLKLQCEKFWTRKLNRMAKRYREHLRMALGHVGKKGQAYISGAGFNEWQQEQERQQAWIDAMQIRNEQTGEVISLRTAFDSGLGNPENRFAEMVTRAKGLQELADEKGYAALFVTWTCPSRYHFNKGEDWTGEGARQAQQYLANIFSCARSKLDREEVERFGIRVAEAHKDGCPHWHMLFWHRPEDADKLRDILYYYALKDSPDEKGARRHRCTFKEITPEEGDAVSYVLKYIDKNIGGNSGHSGAMDNEAGIPVEEGAKRVRAWASKWGLRQFQFYGTAKVTVWRELYRMQQSEAREHDLSDAWQAVKDKSWADFQRSLEGREIKTAYEVTEYGNAYAEVTKKLKGLLIEGAEVITRKVGWLIEKVPKVPDGGAVPWTRRNNCTEVNTASDLRGLAPPDYSPTDIEELDIFKNTTTRGIAWAIP